MSGDELRRWFFERRREELRGIRFRERLRAAPIMDQTRSERTQAQVRFGSALGHGSGVEVYIKEEAA